MITFSENQQEIIDKLIVANQPYWIENPNDTITCCHCNAWFYKTDRYSYMRYCPYCGIKLVESEGSE